MQSTLRRNSHQRGGYQIYGASVYNKEGKPLSHLDKESLTCNACELLLRDPHQIILCGHRYCQICVAVIITRRPLQCPVDLEDIRTEHIRLDRGCANEIKSLLVDCPAKARGCPWCSALTKIEEHLSECLFTDAECSFCGILFIRKEIETHQTQICAKRPLPCQHCSQPQPAGDLKDHYLECLYVPVACKQCHEEIPKKELDDHMKEDCTETVVKCTFCKFEDKLPAVNNHYASRHMHRIVKSAAFPSQAVGVALTSKLNFQLEPRSLVERDSAHGLDVHEQGGVGNPQALVRKVYDDYGSSSSIGNSETSSSFGSSVVPATNSLKEAQESFQYLQKEGAALKEWVQDLKGKIEKQHSQLAGAIEKIQAVQESVSRHALTMEEIKLRQDILDVKTVMGVFIWKIPDIRRRYKDALDRRTLSLYSPPFHTSPHGYRMCVRAYLNGDGSGKTTHVSVFFVLMRSEHDSLLPWPFQQAVTFQLINQRDHSKSVTETFLPDLHSPSFQQPQSEMNIASGFPRFVAQSYLKNDDFISGNAIYIKCKVNLDRLPNE